MEYASNVQQMVVFYSVRRREDQPLNEIEYLLWENASTFLTNYNRRLAEQLEAKPETQE